MSLRENVQACADRYGISIRQLEKQLHIANKSISTWNEHRPSVDKVCAVADFFHVSMDWLIDRETPVSKQEMELLDNFRLLDEGQKKTILDNVDFLLSQKPIRKETQIS